MAVLLFTACGHYFLLTGPHYLSDTVCNASNIKMMKTRAPLMGELRHKQDIDMWINTPLDK